MSEIKKISFRRPRHAESIQLQFGTRLFAFIIDYIVVNTMVFPLITWTTGISLGWKSIGDEGFLNSTLLSTSIFYIYFAIMEGTIGASLGKLFVRLRVYNSDGSKLTLAKAFMRFPAKIISMATLIGVLMIDINKQKQGLHDLVCSTIVRRV